MRVARNGAVFLIALGVVYSLLITSVVHMRSNCK